jgi:TP901 family phage tail tape measure protein
MRINALSKDKIANAQAIKIAEKEYRALNRTMRATQMQIDSLRKSVGITGMTVQQLRNHLNALRVRLFNMPGSMGTPMFKALQAEIAATQARLTTLTTGASRLSQAWTRMEKAANRAGTVIGWAAMVIFGLSMVISAVTKRMKELEDLVGSTRKNTNLLVGEVWEMKDAFDKWDTRTSTDDLMKLAIVAGKLGLEGKEKIMKFVDAANKIQIALGDDLQGSVEDTVTSIGKLMSAFRIDKKMPIEEALLRTGDVLNDLAKSSAASAGTILEYMTRLSAVGELAGFSIDEIGGLGSTLDALHVPSERGATALQKIMLQLANPKKISSFAEAMGLVNDATGTMSEKYIELLKTDPNKILTTLLTKFVSTKDGLSDLTSGLKEFGVRGQYMTAVLGSLALNLDVLRQQQQVSFNAWTDHVSVMNEYDIMNNNFTAQIEKQHKAMRAQTDHMNKNMEPAVLALLKTWVGFVTGIRAATDWIGRNWTMLKILTMAYIALKAPTLFRISSLAAETIVTKYNNIAAAIKVSWLKLELLWTRNLTIEQLRLLAVSNTVRIARVLFTQGITAAWQELAKLQKATIAVKYAQYALLGTVVLLAAAFLILVVNKKKLSEAEKIDREARKKINSDYFEELGHLNTIIDRLKDKNIGEKERKDMIQEIIDQYGEYLPLLKKEGLTAEEVVGSYEKLIEITGRKVIHDNLIKAAGENNAKLEESRALMNSLNTEIDQQRKKLLEKGKYEIGIFGGGETQSKIDDLERKLKRAQKAFQQHYDFQQNYASQLKNLEPKNFKSPVTEDELTGAIKKAKVEQQQLKTEIALDQARMKIMGNSNAYTEQDKIATQIKIDNLENLGKAIIKYEESLKNLTEIKALEEMMAKNEVTYAKAIADLDLNFKREETTIKEQGAAKGQTNEQIEKALRKIRITYLETKIADMKLYGKVYDADEEKYLEARQELAELMYGKEIKGGKKSNKEKLDLLEAWNDKEMAAINLRHLQGLSSEDEFEDELLKQQLVYYSRKMGLFEKDSKEYQDANLKYYEVQVAAEDNIQQKLTQVRKKLSKLKIDTLDNDMEREIALENDRWEEEKLGLEEQLIFKERLGDKEVEHNRIIYDLITNLAERHAIDLEKISKKPEYAELEKSKNAIDGLYKLGTDKFSNNDQLKKAFGAKNTLLKQQYKKELALAGQDTQKQKEVNDKYLVDQQNLTMEQFDAEKELHLSRLNWADQYINSLRGIVGEQSAVGKALLLLQKGIAIAEVWVGALAANAKITLWAGGIPPPANVAAIAYAATVSASNLTFAVLQTGLIAATTIAEVAQWAKGQYPVIGAEDGRTYNAINGGNPITGVYSRPTMLNMSRGPGLVGERAPELVVDGATFRQLQLNAPGLLDEIYTYAGRGRGRTQSIAPTQKMPTTQDRPNRETARLVTAVNRLNEHLDRGIRAKVAGYGGEGSVADAIKKISNLAKSLDL